MFDIIEASIIPYVSTPHIFLYGGLFGTTLLLFGVIFFGIWYLEQPPKKFSKIKQNHENPTPLLAFEKELFQILSRPKDVDIKLSKFIRKFLRENLKIENSDTKTLAELKIELDNDMSEILSILEKIEYGSAEISEKNIESIREKLLSFANRYFI